MTEKTMQEKSIFSKLSEINVNDKTEKKGKFRYLSWTYAWEELQKICPDAIYEIVKFDGLPYKENTRGECIVFTKLTINKITHEMWLPVMDFQNKAMKNPSMFDINKAIMRCLVKNIAMFGLGLYIYAGEDLPEEMQSGISQKQKPVEKKQEPQKQSNLTVSFDTLKGYLMDSNSSQRAEVVWKRGEQYIKNYTQQQQEEINNIYNAKLKQFNKV